MLSAKQNVLNLYNRKKTEFLPMFGQGIINNVPVNGYRERSELGVTGSDWFGVRWIWDPKEPAPMPDPKGILEDISDWREVVAFPDLDKWDWEKAAITDRIDTFDFENNALYQMIHNGLFERLHEVMGFENAMCAMLTDSDAVLAFFEKLTEYKLKLIDKIAEYYHPDIICYHDDWGTQRGLFFSPETWRSLIKEPTKRIVEHVHSKGILFELHCCGDIRTLIPEIVDDLGVDGLNIMKLNDIPAMKQLTKDKVVYSVYLDTQSLDVLSSQGALTEQQFRESIRNEFLTLGKGGYYIPQMLLVRQEWQQWIMEEYDKCKYSIR